MSDYNAGIQNWAIAQDERGVMYFGNNSGLLEFDGSAWRLYELPTKGIVRAIYISEDGRIYVGSTKNSVILSVLLMTLLNIIH